MVARQRHPLPKIRFSGNILRPFEPEPLEPMLLFTGTNGVNKIGVRIYADVFHSNALRLNIFQQSVHHTEIFINQRALVLDEFWGFEANSSAARFVAIWESSARP